MYLEYSASGTIETNNIYDNMSLGKYVGIEYVRANAEDWELCSSWATPQSPVLEARV